MQIAADELDVPLNMIDLIDVGHVAHARPGHDGRQPVDEDELRRRPSPRLRRGAAGPDRDGAPRSSVCRRTRSSRTDGAVVSSSDSSKRATYGELIGGQQFNLKSTGRAPLKKPAELKVVGRSITHVDVPEKVQASSSTSRTSRCRGCSTAASSARRGSTRRSSASTASRSESPTWSRSSSRRTSSASSPAREAGAIRAAKELKVTWKDPGGVPANYDALYAKWRALPARRGCSSTTATSTRRSPARRRCRGHLLLPVPAARVDGPVLRGRRREGGRGDGLVADAGRLSAPHGRGEGARLQGPAGARDLQGRLGLLRPERRRHRLDRRGADVEGRRCAGARAVDARGRARLGALRDADGHEGQGRPRRGRQPDRLGLREPPGLARRPARQRRRGEPADRRPDRAHARPRAGERSDASRRSARTTRTRSPATCRTRRASSRTPA